VCPCDRNPEFKIFVIELILYGYEYKPVAHVKMHCSGLTLTELTWVQGVSYLNILAKGFQEVEAPRFQDSRHMKVVRLSGLRIGRLYPPGNIPGTHFC